MDFQLRLAQPVDAIAIQALIAASVRLLQPEYTPSQREAALRTVFTIDSQLIADQTYFIAETDGVLAGCGGWSFRGTLCGGDHHIGAVSSTRMDQKLDAAKIRAIFVAPQFARRGLGTLLLRAAEKAAMAAGFLRLEMGSTLAGVALYKLEGYIELEHIQVPVGATECLDVVRMQKLCGVGGDES